MKVIDMRGQACPIPVINAKKSLAEPDTKGVVVLVDNSIAVQNLERMATGTGCAFSCKEDGALYSVSIVKDVNADPAVDASLEHGAKDPSRGPVVLISSNSLGRGPDSGANDLGQILIKGFIFSLAQLNPPPEAVLFLNSGALLTAEGSNTVPDLKTLEANGSKVHTCGTCANYYKTQETLAVGSTVDMMMITNYLAKASSVITL